MTKLLWHSNSPLAPTGYGQQTALMVPPIAENYEVAISTFYGLQGAPITWNGIPVLPGLGETFGNEFLLDHATNFFGDGARGGLVVTLMDVWVLHEPLIAQMNVASWVPVDHEPASPGVVKYFRESGAVPLAMSRFGEQELGEFDPIYVPHGVDVDSYKPIGQANARKLLGLPQDRFIAGMVAANKGAPSRKGFSEALQAWRKFIQKNPDAVLYLHTDLDHRMAGGEDIGGLIDSLQIPARNLLYANPYVIRFAPLPPRDMAKLYSAFDVLLNPAHGEGFGIPVLEAQACGTPAIVTDFSAMKEVCGAGWKIPPRPWWTGQGSWQGIPDVPSIADALEECAAQSREDKASLSKKARTHALEYAVPKVIEEHFLPALAALEERVGERTPLSIAA